MLQSRFVDGPNYHKANSQEQSTSVDIICPNITNIGVNQQVNNNIAAHFGGGTHVMANAIETSSKGELANYHHQSLGSPTMWSILNVLKNHPAELMSMPGMNKDLITRYLEQSTATAKEHMVRVWTHIWSTHSDRPARLKARQEVEDLALNSMDAIDVQRY